MSENPLEWNIIDHICCYSEEEFNQWLWAEKAQAWDEGYTAAGFDEALQGSTWGRTENPRTRNLYRIGDSE